MLQTATKELRKGIKVTCQEQSNEMYYAARRLYLRIAKPDDDDDMQGLRSRFVMIATRTISAEGIELFRVQETSADEELEAEFKRFMSLPRKLSEAWEDFAAEVGETAPKN